MQVKDDDDDTLGRGETNSIMNKLYSLQEVIALSSKFTASVRHCR